MIIVHKITGTKNRLGPLSMIKTFVFKTRKEADYWIDHKADPYFIYRVYDHDGELIYSQSARRYQ